MAIVKFFQATDMSQLSIDEPEITGATSSQLTTVDGNETEHYYGSFSYTNGTLSGGTVTGYDRYVNGAKTHEVTGVSLSATKVASYIVAGDAEGLFGLLLGGADTFTGSSGSDVLQGFAGNDAIDGGLGVDTAVYSGLRSSYTITKTTSGYTVSGADGTDTLTNIEQLRFSDGSFDISTIVNTGGTGGTGGTDGTGGTGGTLSPELMLVSSGLNGQSDTVGTNIGPQTTPAVSADGSIVVFNSSASNIVTGDTASTEDTFWRNLSNGGTATLVITQRPAYGENFSISADGRYVAFDTSAPLTAGDKNQGYYTDVYVRDMVSGTVQLVSADASGGSADYGRNPSLSADGKLVAFESNRGFVASDTNNSQDIYVKNLTTGVFQRVTTTSAGAQVVGGGMNPEISADGRYVVFESTATTLVAGDTNQTGDVFRKDLQTGEVLRVSTTATGAQTESTNTSRPNSYGAEVSADGRYVAFLSNATNLVAGDTNEKADVFRKDMLTGEVLRASVGTNGAQTARASEDVSMSGDGRYIVFTTYASDLIEGVSRQDTGSDVYIKDMVSGELRLVSDFGAADLSTSLGGQISADGRYVVLKSTYPTADIHGYQIYRVTNPFLESTEDTGGNTDGSGTDTDTGENVFKGTASADVLTATAGNDILTGGAGNDTLNGGDGIDIATYSGARTSYVITQTSDAVSSVRQVGGSDGTDALTGIERIKFSDTSLAYDIDGHAGQAYRLYQAAFNRTPDLPGLGWQIKAMDEGAGLLQLAQNFMNSAEFQSLYGTNPSTTTFVNLLYNNVLHRTPEQFETDFWVNIIDKGIPEHQTTAEVLMNFSESAENQLQVIGSIQNGIQYMYYA